MATTDYAKTMARLPDESLARIANPAPGEDYERDAIDAARRELTRRGISVDELEMPAPTTVEMRHDGRVDEPLSTAGRIGFFLFGFTVLGMLAALILGMMGYTRKFEAAMGASVLGFIVIWATVGGAAYLATF
ncbi:hypothetical protein [Sphingomonas sp.]|uniref:hypothetical protein n=1 Tax=Sphingomonas sp. TaxID=28214 RepID=UPI001B1BEF3C|nr:hypothetical protein [Sphingomonas sp.]MBO9711530.1 hypothetical protein [Sphingomonas sp.]